MNTLSLCMIARDEEGVLARCLDSIQHICDEIILVDTGSKDKTVEIAKRYPQCKVEHFTWIDDFGAARNYSFSFASKDLILWLDCDDIVKPEDVEKIKRLKERPLSDLKDAYICNYHYSHDHLDNITVTLKRERIFKRSVNPRWKYRIHECIPLYNFPNIEYNSGISIHHYKTGHQIARAEGRNVRMLKQCVEDPNETCERYEFYYGKELSEIDPDTAEIYLKKYLEHYDWYEDAFYATFKIAQIYFNRKNYDESMKWCLDALKLDMRRGDVFCFLGLIFINKSRWDLARFWYTAALDMPKPEDSLGFFDMTYHTYTPHCQLSYVHYNLGNYEKSAFHAEKALGYRKDDGMAKHNLNMANKALGKTTPKKWAIYIPFNYDINNPNIRLRKVNIQKALKKRGFDAEIVQNFSNLNDYDFIFSHSLFSQAELKHLKSSGKVVGYDLAEGWFDSLFYSTIKDYNLVTCSSSKLKNFASKLNGNCIHVPDSFEAK